MLRNRLLEVDPELAEITGRRLAQHHWESQEQ
jgi:hypothetical protein